MNRPYSEASPNQDPYGALAEEIALRTAQRYGLPADQNEFELAMMHAALDAVTAALHRARTEGLLPPEGAETRTEWGTHVTKVAAGQRSITALLAEMADVLHRLAQASEAHEKVLAGDAVRLAVGDSQPNSQDPSASVEETARNA